MRTIGFAIVLAAVIATSLGADGVARNPFPHTWFPVGGVSAIAVRGSTLYLSGGFNHFARVTGMFISLSRDTGEPDLTVPKVMSVENRFSETSLNPDGQGGYIIGGPFGAVDGVSRPGLARINAAGRLDTTFVPPPDVLGTGVAVLGNRVFATRRPDAVFRLMALDLATGHELPFPSVRFTNQVVRLFAGPNNLILAHDFLGLHAIDATTGAVRWEAPASVFTLAGDTAFIVRGLSVLRLNLLTGAVSPFIEAQGTSCPSTCFVGRVLFHRNTLYLTGRFEAVGGVSRDRSAAVDATSGSVLPWTAPAGPDGIGPVNLWADGNHILALYSSSWGGRRLIALDAITGEATGWRGDLIGGGNDPIDVVGEPNHIVVFGYLSGAGGIDRPGVAQVTWPDAAPTAWRPELPLRTALPGYDFRSMARVGSRLFVGDNTGFGLFEFDADSGALRSHTFPLGPGGGISAMQMGGSRLYVAGRALVAGTTVTRLVAIELSSPPRVIDSWSPQIGGGTGVYKMLALPGAIVFSGDFLTVDGVPRPGVAAVEETSGGLLPWDLGSRGYADSSLATDGEFLWLGGRFGQQAFDYQGRVVLTIPRYTDLNQLAFFPTATPYGDFLYISQAGYAVHRRTGQLSRWTPNVDRRFPLGRFVSAEHLGLVIVDNRFLFFPRVSAPGDVSPLVAQVTGNSLALNWTGVSGATSYVIEAGSASALSDLAVLDTGTQATAFATNGPSGVYHLRVRALGDGGLGVASNELRIALGPGGCASAPSSPSGLQASVDGRLVTLQWSATSGPITRYTVHVGLSSGQSNLASLDVGDAVRFSGAAPPGRYFVRVVAENLCGTSAASNEIELNIS